MIRNYGCYGLFSNLLIGRASLFPNDRTYLGLSGTFEETEEIYMKSCEEWDLRRSHQSIWRS